MRVNFVCWLIKCPFHPHVTAVACKRPRSFCQKCRWQVMPKHTYTFDPSKSEWADCAAVLGECWNLSGNELTCNSSGNTRLVIFAGWATVDWSWPKEWNYFARAKLHVKKRKRRKKKCRRGLNILPKSWRAWKKPPPPDSCNMCAQGREAASGCGTASLACSDLCKQCLLNSTEMVCMQAHQDWPLGPLRCKWWRSHSAGMACLEALED